MQSGTASSSRDLLLEVLSHWIIVLKPTSLREASVRLAPSISFSTNRYVLLLIKIWGWKPRGWVSVICLNFLGKTSVCRACDGLLCLCRCYGPRSDCWCVSLLMSQLWAMLLPFKTAWRRGDGWGLVFKRWKHPSSQRSEVLPECLSCWGQGWNIRMTLQCQLSYQLSLGQRASHSDRWWPLTW